MKLLEVVKNIIKTIDDEVSAQEALKSIADLSVLITPALEWSAKIKFGLLQIKQKLNYFKTPRSSSQMDSLEAFNEVTDQIDIKVIDFRPWTPSADD